MKRIYIRKNQMIAGQFVAMGSEAEVPDEIADDLMARGQAHLLEPKPKKKSKSKKKPAPTPEA